MKNDCLDAALAELAVHGIRDVEVARGAKHPQIRFRVNGGPTLHVFALPGTASDWRSPKNTRRDLKKLLREAGVNIERERPKPPTRAPSRIELLEQRVAALEALSKPKPKPGEPAINLTHPKENAND